eukprot:488674-Pyramimonas_sp.AAC.1
MMLASNSVMSLTYVSNTQQDRSHTAKTLRTVAHTFCCRNAAGSWRRPGLLVACVNMVCVHAPENDYSPTTTLCVLYYYYYYNTNNVAFR